MAHNEVGKDFDGVLQGIVSTSATKLCHPSKTYVAPDVDHGTACTCHWNFVGYLEPVGGCTGSSQ
jgi:hypothetical protein